MAKTKKSPVEVKVKIEFGETRISPDGLLQEIKITPPLELDPSFGHLLKIESGTPPITPARYLFPRKPRCPKCKTLGSRPTSTRDGVQHRKCRRPSCRHRWKVPGILTYPVIP